MLIYWLFIILVLNLIISYKATKCIISPPLFFNLGFAVACYFAILFYKEWDMQLLRMNTFLSIALGCSIFSIVSIIYIRKNINDDGSCLLNCRYSQILKRYKLKIFLILCCVLQFLVLYLKMHYYKMAFGGYLSFGELLFASRMNFFDEDSISVFPFWFRNVMQLFTVLNFCFYALLSNLVLSKERQNKVIIFLLLINILLQMACSLFDGARGGVASSLFCLTIIFVLRYFRWTGKSVLPMKLLSRFLLLAIVAGTFLKASAEFVGRDTNEESSMYYFAYYCGGQVKNLDIYMGHEKFSENFGDATFLGFYSELNKYIPIKVPKAAENIFSEYKGQNLGNVYTTFYNFYYDGGLWGVLFFTILMSLLASAVFVKTQRSYSQNLALSEFVYAQVCFSLFMCFFANRFYSEILCISFFKKIIYFLIISYYFNKSFFKINRNGKNCSSSCNLQ